MTTFRKFLLPAVTISLFLGATTAKAGELDEALRPRSIASIVELASLDVPVARQDAGQPQPQQDAPARPEQPAQKPAKGFWEGLSDLFSF